MKLDAAGEGLHATTPNGDDMQANEGELRQSSGRRANLRFD